MIHSVSLSWDCVQAYVGARKGIAERQKQRICKWTGINNKLSVVVNVSDVNEAPVK
jgi:hypothetical protein